MQDPTGASRSSSPSDAGIGNVAVQSEVHAPQPREHIHEEDRSIVVEGQDRASDRELLPYTASSTEETVVIRDRAVRKAIKARGKPRWASTAVWVGAGVLVFGFGGVLALLSGGPVPRSSAESPKANTTPVVPKPRSAQPAQMASVQEEPVPLDPFSEPEPQAPAPESPPKEPAEDVAPKAMRATAKPKAVTAPRAKPKPKPASVAPSKMDIPSGI